ncbi:MAG: pyridoxamine 5'-phosphate oxidase family protein [Candidatus Thorarchaeota archaeon]
MSRQIQDLDVSKRKWIYEEIVDRVPPFSWLPSVYDVIAQLMLVETVGIIAFIYFKMPIESAIFGSLAILYTVIWSAGCLYIVPWIRRLKNPTNEEELDVLIKYRKRLLLDRRLELVSTVSLFAVLVAYLWYDNQILQQFLGIGYGNPILTLLILMLAWDISYRLGLSLVTTLLSTHRSIRLGLAARRRRGLEYTAYSEINTLKRLDYLNLYWGISAILLLPLAMAVPLMLYGLLLYLGGILGLTLLNFMAIETVPWLPPDLQTVLHKERFAYVSLCSKNRPHTTPVIFVYDGKFLYFAISIASAKYRIIRKNPNVAVLVDMRSRENPMDNRTILMRGKALILGEISPMGIWRMFQHGLWMLRVRWMMGRKYPRYLKYYSDRTHELPLAWQSKPMLSRVLVRVEPESIIYWREARPTTMRV